MVESAAKTVPMDGKVCLVTGATAGIGRVSAGALAAAGARVILVGRNPSKCETAVNEIREATGNERVEALVADLSLQGEVRRLAAEVRDRTDRLDVLLNNAGAMFDARAETAEGVERTWALDHLAYFLLTNLLLDLLEAAAPSRVVSVASEAHRMAPGIDFDDPQLTRRYGMMRAYSQAKLANVLFSNELARRLQGKGVTSNALHPGFVLTSFFDGKGWAGPLMKLGARLAGVTAEDGAKTSIHLASSPEVADVTGAYFSNRKPVTPSRPARDAEAAARLWTLSEEMTGLAAVSR